MAKVIVGIHGLANKPPEPKLKEWWRASIDEGLKANLGKTIDYEFVHVYWADLMYPSPLVPPPQAAGQAGELDDEPYYPADAGVLKRHKTSWTDRLRGLVQPVLGRAIDRLGRRGLDDAAKLVFTAELRRGGNMKDLAFYYDNTEKIRDRAKKLRPTRQVLMDELTNALLPLQARGSDVILIAHSMGTIIAYDVLRNLGQKHNAFQLGAFVTIGSPLGLTVVKTNVVKERTYDAKLRTPTVVSQAWLNFADPRDPIAADPALGDEYGANSKKIKVVDQLIDNDYLKPDTQKANSHKLYGYLRAPEFSEALGRLLT